MADLCNDLQTYAPVLARMIELLGSNPKLSFGVALEQAARERHISIPEHMQEPLLISAFKVMASGKIPGLPEA